MKKRFLLITSVLVLSFALVSCGKDKEPDTTPTPPTASDTETQPTPPENSETDVEEKDDTVKKIASRIFFYNGVDDKYDYIDKDVEVTNGEYVTALTKELENTSYSEDLLTLPKDTKVSSAKLDKDKGILHVYFANDLSKSMNLGSSGDIGLITSLANTFGYNYKVDKVAIYCNGKLYSGHFGEVAEGYFKVDYSDIDEMKTK